MASSFEDLDQLGKSTAGCSQERRWHSTEVLSDGIKQTVGRLLHGWEKDREDCESSDSDNLSSLDSLSSAYTKALTEQLMQEETAEPELSDGASDDSQMSQDSLAGTGSGKQLIDSPKVAAQSLQGLRLFNNPSSPGNWLDKWGRSVSLDSLANGEEEETEDHSPQGSGASDEIPAEIYWKLQSPRTQDVHSTVLHKPHMGSEEKRKEMGTLASPLVMDDSPHLGDPFSSVQTHSRERAVSLSLTEAWSSCESSESPRMLKDSLNKSQGLHTKQTLFKTPNKVDGSKQLADNPDLSVTGKGLESLRSETNSCISNLNQQLGQCEKNYWILNGTCVENKAHPGQPIAAISAAKSSTLSSDAGRTESCLAVTLSCSLRSEAEVESQDPIAHGIGSPGSTVFNHLDGRKQDINIPSPTSRSKSLPVTFEPDLVEHLQTTPDKHPAISGSNVTDSESSNHFSLGYPEERLSVVEGTHIHAELNKSVSSGEVCINEQEEGIIRDSNLSSASATAAQIQELTELMLVPVNIQHSLDKGVKKDGVDTSPSFSEQETKSSRAIGDLKHSVKAEATCISGSTCPSAGPNLQVLSVQFRKDSGYTSSEALSEVHPTMGSMLIPNKESSAGTLLNKNRNHSLQAAVFETFPADPALVPDLGITNEEKEFSLAGGDTEELILNPSAENENNGFPNLEPNCGTTMQTDFLQEQQIARPNTGQPTEEFSSTSIRAEVSDMTNTPERTTWEEKGLKSVQVNSSIEENKDLKQQTDGESATTVKDVDTPKTKDGDLVCQTLLEGAEVEENQGKSSTNKSSLLSRHEFRLPGGMGVGQRKDSVATELQNDIKLLMDRTQLECISVQVSDQRTTVRSTNPRLDADSEPLQKEKERGMEIGEGSLGTGMTDEGFNEGSSDNVSVEVCKLSGETGQVDPSVLKDTIKKQIQPSEFRKDICAVKIKNVHLTAPTCKSHVSDLAIKESKEEEKSGDETELGQAGERINIAEGVRLEDTENVRPRGGVERNQQAVRREGKEGKKADSWSMVQRISTGESAQCSSAERENDVPDCGNNEDRESEVQKVANEASIHRNSGVFDVEERHSTIREGEKAAVIPNQTENEAADALGNSKVRKHHHSARYSPIPSGESKLDHTGLLHTNQEDKKAADIHEINERDPKQHADVEAGTLNSTDTNQMVLQFMHKGNMSPQRDSRPTLATRTDKPHHVTRSDIPKGLQGLPIEVCTEGTNGLLKIKVEGTQSSIREGQCRKCVSESMMKSRTPGGSVNGQACNDSAEASHLVLDVSSTTGAKERYTFSTLKETNGATPRDKNAESRTSTERDGAEEDSSASLIAANYVPLTSGHIENHDVGLMSSTNWLENTGGDSLEFPETHSKGNTTEELLISKPLTEKPARPGCNNLIGSPQLPPPNFSASSEGLCFLLNPEQLNTCKPAVLKDNYVRIDMANFCLDSKKQSRFPPCSQNHERVRETEGNKEGYVAQAKAQKIYPGTSQCNTGETSMERLKYAQIGDTGNFHSGVYEEESEEKEAAVPGEVEGSAIQISGNMTSGKIGTKQCHYSTHIPRIAEGDADLVVGTNDSHERAGASNKTSLKMERTKMIMYDHLCSRNTEAASTDTEHISLDSECNKPLSTEERSMATQDAGAKGFPQQSKNQHGNKRSSLEGSLHPSSHTVGSEAFNHRDRRNQEDVTEPSLEPEENYLENISRPSKEEYSPPERGVKESVKMKATSQQDSQTTTPGVDKIQMDPGAQDYFDIRMSNWTVQHGQPVQYVPERSTQFNKMNQIQSSVLQTSHFSVHEGRSDTEMCRGIESSDQSLAFGTPSEKDPPVSLNREGAFAIQTVSDVVLTHRPLEAGSDKAYQQRHEQLEQLHETAARTRVSIGDCRHSRHKTGSVENLKVPDFHTWPNKDQPRICTTTAAITHRIHESQQPSSSASDHSKNKDRTASKSRRSKPLGKSSSEPKGSAKSNRCLKRIKMLISQSVSPGIKTILAGMFRKPPSGQAGRATKSSKKAATRLSCSLERSAVKERPIKMASSFEDLDQLGKSTAGCSQERRWHSTEVLSDGIKQTVGRLLDGWEEDREDCESSDSDNLSSLDSLSSAYTKALTEQLMQEETAEPELSDGASGDSQMSQDSLAGTGSGKQLIDSPKVAGQSLQGLRLFNNPSSPGNWLDKWGRSVSLDSLANGEEEETEDHSPQGSGASDEIPAEIYWKLQSPRTQDVHSTVLHKPHMGSEEKRKEMGTLASPPVMDDSPHLGDPFSSVQTHSRERAVSLSLTEAWSSCESSESPRMLKDSLNKSQGLHTKQTLFKTPNKVDGSKQLADNPDLSVTGKGLESLRSETNSCISNLNQQLGQCEKNYWILNGTCVENKAHPGQPIAAISAAKSSTLGSDAGRTESCLAVTLSCSLRSEAEVESQAPISHGIGSPGSTVFNHLDGRKQDINIPSPTSRSKSLPVTFEPDLVEHLQTTPDKHPAISGSNVTDSESSNHFSLGYPEERLSVVEGTHIHAELNKSVSSGEVCINEQEEGIIRDSNLSSASATAAQIQELTELMLVPVNTQHSLDKGVKKDGVDTSPSFSEQETKSSHAIGDLKHSVKAEATCISGSTCPSAGPNLQVLSVQFRKDSGYTSSEALSEVHPTMGSMLIPNKESSAGTLLNKNRNHSLQAAVFETFPADPALVPDLGITNEEKEFSLAGGDTEELILNPSAENENNGFPNLEPNCGTTMQTDFLQEQQIARPNTGQPTEEFSSTSIRAEVSDMTNTPERTTWEEKGLKSVQVNSSIEENKDLKQQTDGESATTVKDVDTPKTKDGDLVCQTLLEGAEVEENQGKSSTNKSSLLSRHELRLPGGVGVGVGQRKDSVATELQNDIKLLMDRTQLECISVQVSDQRTTVRSTNPRLDADSEPLQKEKERGMEIGEGSLGTGMTDEGFNEGSSDNVSVEVCKLSGETGQVDPSVLKDTIKKQIQPSEFRKDICAVKIKNVHLTAPTCKSHVSDLAIKESKEEEKSGDETELGQAGERINIAEGVRLEDTENVRPRGGVERNQQAVRREGKEGKKADSWSMVQRISTGESAQCSSAERENDVPDCGNNEDRESEVQKVANEASIHRNSGVFDVEERHSTIREGEKAAVIPNQTENEAADALGNSKVRKHHHSARYSPIPSGESKLDHTGLLHTNQEDKKAADIHEINERDPKQHADVEAGTLNSTDTNQMVLQFMHKGNMSPQRDSRPTLATRTDKPHHVTRSDIPKGLQGLPIEVCTEGTNGLLKIKVEGTQSSLEEGHCGKCVSESMMKSRTPGGSVNGQACNGSAEASHLVLDVSSTTGAKERYTFSTLKETNGATPRDKNAESRTSTERDGAEEDSSASLIAANYVPLTSGHIENHDVGLMSSTNWLENTGGDSLEFPETHSKGNTTEELLISKHRTEKPARPGSNNLIGSPQFPPPNFIASSEGLCFLLNPEQLNTCKPAVLKDNYVRIDMANFCLDSKKQSRFPPCSQNHERVRETEGNKEGYVAQAKAQKIYPGTSQCNTGETSMERLKYAQIGDTGNFHSGVYEEESEEKEAAVPGEVEGSAIQISGNMTSGKIGTKQCHYSTHIPRIAEGDADLVVGTNDSHERAGASNKTSLKMERTKMIMYDHLCSRNTEAASTDTEHISLDSECNKPLSTEERSMATQDAGAKGFPQQSKNQHGNKRSSLEGSLHPSSHTVGSEAFNHRDRRNQEDVTEPSLEPEENYLENISRPSKEEYSPPERGVKESVKMKATSQQDSQTTTPGVDKIQMDPGAQDYFDIRMSNWTVQHGQPVQYVPERSTQFNKMNQIQSSVLQTSHFSVHEGRSDTEMCRGIESSDQSLAFGTPSEKDPPVSLNREGAFAIQTVSDVVLTHRPLEAGSDKAYQQRHEQLEQLHETAALLKDSTAVALSSSETDQNKAPESLISLAGRLKKGSKTSLVVDAAIAEEGDHENTASSHSGVQSTALKRGVCKCEGQKEGKQELASRDIVLIVNPKECQEYTTVYITPQTPNNNHNDQPNAAFLKSTPLNVAVHDRPVSKAAQPENNLLKSTTHLRGTPLYFTEKPSLSLLECLQGQDKHIVQRTCSEEQHNPTLTDKSAGSKHEEGPVNISVALNSSEGIGKKQISCGTPGVESREQGVLNLSSSKEQRQTDLPAAVLTEIAVIQDYRRGNVSISSTSAVGFIKLPMAEENSAKDVEADSVDNQVIQRSAGIEFNSNQVPVFSTTLSPQALGKMHVQQKITEKQATQRHRELEADGNITVPYTHIQYPTVCGATVGSHGVATTSAPSSVHRSSSLEDLESLSIPECTVSDPAKEDSSSTDDRGAFWDNGDRATVDKNQKKKQKLRRGKPQPPPSESYNSSSSTSQDTTHSSSQEQSGEHLGRSPDRPSASSPSLRSEAEVESQAPISHGIGSPGSTVFNHLDGRKQDINIPSPTSRSKSLPVTFEPDLVEHLQTTPDKHPAISGSNVTDSESSNHFSLGYPEERLSVVEGTHIHAELNKSVSSGEVCINEQEEGIIRDSNLSSASATAAQIQELTELMLVPVNTQHSLDKGVKKDGVDTSPSFSEQETKSSHAIGDLKHSVKAEATCISGSTCPSAGPNLQVLSVQFRKDSGYTSSEALSEVHPTMGSMLIPNKESSAGTLLNKNRNHSLQAAVFETFPADPALVPDLGITNEEKEFSLAGGDTEELILNPSAENENNGFPNLEPNCGTTMQTDFLQEQQIARPNTGQPTEEFSSTSIRAEVSDMTNTPERTTWEEKGLKSVQVNSSIEENKDLKQQTDGESATTVKDVDTPKTKDGDLVCQTLLEGAEVEENQGKSSTNKSSLLSRHELRLPGGVGVGVGQRKDSVATELQNDIKLLMDRTQLECISVQVSDQRTTVRSTNPRLDADSEPLQKEKERGMEIGEGSLGTGMTDEGFNEGSSDNVSVEVCKLSGETGQVDPSVLKDTIKKQIQPSEFRKDICAVKIKNVHLTAPTCKSHVSDLAIKESKEEEKSGDETELGQAGERINIAEGVRLEDTENVRPRGGVERNQQAVRRDGKEGKKADSWSMVQRISTGESAQCSSAVRENDVPDCGNNEDRESEVQKDAIEASIHRNSGVFDVEERHSTIREGEKAAVIPNQTENEAADALGNSKVRKHHHSARYSPIPSGESKLDHTGLLHTNQEDRKAADVHEINERNPKQHADVEAGTLNSIDTNQAVLQFMHKGNMSPQRDSRPTLATRTDKPHHVTRSDIPKGLQGRPIEVCTEGTNGLLKIKVEGTQSSIREGQCRKCVSESMMKSRTPGGSVNGQACNDSAEASHLVLDVSSTTGAKEMYNFSTLKETNSATPRDRNAESRTSTERDGAEEDSSASLIAANYVPLTSGHIENHDVGLMSSTNWLENTGGDSLEFPETHSKGNTTEELLISKPLTEKPARPGCNNLIGSPQFPPPNFIASSEGLCFLLNPEQLNTCKPAVLKDNYVRIDMANFCLDSKKQSRFPPCSQNHERVRETEGNKEGYVAQAKAQKIYPGTSQCNTGETSMERLKYAQIGDTGNFHSGVYEEESEEKEAAVPGEVEGSAIQISGNMTSGKIGTKQCHYSTHIPRIAEGDADLVVGTNDSHERAGASNKTSLKMERTKMIMYDHLCSRNTEAASTDTEHISLDSECNKPLSTEERSMATQDAGAKGFPQQSKNQHGNKRSSLEGSLYPSSHTVGSEAFNYRDRRNQEDVTEPSLEPEENYLENISRPSKEEYSPPERGVKESVKMKATSQQDSQTTTPGVDKIQMDPGAQDYFDISMSNWTVQHGQPVQYVPERSTQFNKMNQIQSSVLQTSHFSVHEGRSDTEMCRGIESSDQSLAFGTPSEKDPPVSLNREGAFAIQTVSDVVLTHRPLEAGSDKAYQQRHEQLEQLHETAALLKDSTAVALSGSETDQNKAPESLISFAGRLKKGSKTSLVVGAVIAEEGDNENTASSHSSVQSTALKGWVSKCEGQKEGKEELASGDIVLIVNPKECQEYTTVYITPQTPNNNNQPNAPFLKSTPLNVAVHDRPVSKAAQPENNPLKSTTHLRGTLLYSTEKPSLSLLECLQGQDKHIVQRTCSEKQHNPTLTNKSAGSKHEEGPVNISAALNSSEGIGKKQISCGTPGVEFREQGVLNLSSFKEQRQTDLPAAVLTEIAVAQDYRRGNVLIGSTSAVGFIKLPMADENSAKDVEANSVDIQVIQRSAGIEFNSNQVPVFSTTLSPQALGEMHVQQKIPEKQATQRHRELEADWNITVPYTHIQYPTVCGATVGSHRVATTSAPSSVHRSSSLEDLESLSIPECTLSDPAKEDSSSTDDRGAFWDNGDRATVDKNQKKKQKVRRGKPQPPPSESYNSSSSTSQDTTHSSSREQSGEHLGRSPDRPSASSPRYRGNKHSEHSRLENSNEEHRAYSQKHRLSALIKAGLPSDAEHGVESTANFHQGFRGMHAQSNGEFHLSKSPIPPDDDTRYLQPGALKDAKTSLKSPSHKGKLFKKNTKTSCNEDPEYTSSRPLTTRHSGANVMTHHSTGEGAQVPFLSHHRRHSRQSSRKERCHPQEGTSGMHDEKEMMHFGSSDINPYVHPWRQEETTRVGWKHHAFGSASDISCQPPLQDGSNQRVMRCSSVDNGLNVQNSPLHSHLSSYANARATSSTLSSVEDFQGQDSFDTEYNSHQHSHPRPRDALNLESRVSSYQIPPGALGNSSVQVDEIMLLYPSEPKSTVKSLSEVTLTVTCDQGTQTSAEARQRKVNRHRRSSTQVPVSRKEDEENVAQRPTSWASLQNMSIHLSQLLHNTSDLLGNLNSLGARDPQLQPIRPFQSNTPDSLHSYIPSNGRRTMDSCTQTSVDVGIQTDYLHQAVRVIKQHLPVEVTKRPQEVNVIVKVVGSDILNISQENKDITLTLLEREKKATVKMQSMPDLRIGNASVFQTSLESHHSAFASPVCVRTSTPSLESDQNSAPTILGLSPVGPPSSLPGQSSSPSNLVRGCSISSPQLSRLENQVFQEGDTDRDCSLSSKAKAHSKQVQMVDRASSPILTLEAGISSPVARSKSTQCLTDGENPELQEDSLDGQRKYQSSFRYGIQEPRDSHHELTESEDGLQRDNHFITTSRTTDRVVADVGKVSVVSEPRMRGRKSYPLKPVPSSMEDVCNSAGTKYFVDRSGRQIPVKMDWQSSSEEINLRKSSSVQHLPGSCSSAFSRLQGCATSAQIRSAHELLAISTQENTSTQTHEGSLTIRTPCKTNAAHYLTASDGCEGWIGSASCHNQSPDPYPFEPSEVSEMTIQLQEDNDDATSVAPSECNTEVLLNINPIVDDPQTSSHNHGKCRVPEDLPLHNKFSDWSGVHLHPPSRLSSAAVGTASGSQTQKMKRLSQGEPMENDSEFRACEGERMREIEKLRRERAEIMSGVRLEMNPHQLTVELTEAKLNYGLGETDTLLKLHSGAGKETDGVTIKQQLYDRHMKSIEGLRQEREARLQSCRRARSLSPNKHPVLCAGTQGEPASRDPDLPSKRREYLQQLRQGVVESTRVQEPKKWLAQTPSEIELLLRDYGRAREEARTEIARARDRLRERTEQEKRRLQQQALSQLVKEELRLRTRVSTSTLCTGSSLSLSSGPSSGYNSSNTTAPPGGSKATLQAFPSPTKHGFLCAGVIEQPLHSVWCLIRDHSKTHLYDRAIKTARVTSVESGVQLVYLVMDSSLCCLKQPRDFCCISAESKQEEQFVLALRSVYDEALPRPGRELVRGEVLPSAWVLQPRTHWHSSLDSTTGESHATQG
ncbi:UNVERIFIED_CONTAM: hypothetical protein FKN15_047479 [Acipenser sinensis]